MHQMIGSDEAGMRAALAWSAVGRGHTAPRPSVGCVLVKNGVVIGGGHTQPGDGNPHAEVMAIRAAREAGHDLTGATAYVTLEPCSHIGTTPPCTSALIAAGVVRVVAGVRDPNPLINGRGYHVLRAAGIEVVEGFMESECARAQDHFLKHIATGLPFVTLKCAASLDGKIATSSGESQWITGTEARQDAHRLRADHSAILVGANTVLADDPLLTVRQEDSAGPQQLPRKQPARIVLSSRAALGQHAAKLRLFNSASEGGKVIVAVTEDAPPDELALLEERGAGVIVIPARAGRVDLAALTKRLPELGVYSLLIEGGAEVAAAALEAGIVDKVVSFIAPMLIGGDGLSAVAPFGVRALADAPRLLDVRTEQVGIDTVISGYTRPLPGTKEYVYRTC